MFASFVVLLREGVEAAFMLGLMSTYLAKLAHLPGLGRGKHHGRPLPGVSPCFAPPFLGRTVMTPVIGVPKLPVASKRVRCTHAHLNRVDTTWYIRGFGCGPEHHVGEGAAHLMWSQSGNKNHVQSALTVPEPHLIAAAGIAGLLRTPGATAVTTSLIWIGMFIGSTLGGFVPLLWGADLLSFSSLIGSAVGGGLGIWAGYKVGISF